MAFLPPDQLAALGFRALGAGVLISDKASIYGAEAMSIGDNVRIDDFCVLSGRIVLDRNVHISIFCNISGGTAGVTFEAFSGLSPGCHVIAASDDYTGQGMTNPTVPHLYRLETSRPVRIGRHAIIGAKALILPGVVVAEGCAIGAMSMVNASTEPWTLYAGTPARKIRPRARTLLKLEQDYLAAERDGTL